MSSPTSRSIRPRTSASRRLLRHRRQPADGTIWGSVLGFPGSIMRLDPGADPSKTALAEIYEVPVPGLWAARLGHRPQRRRLGAAVERSHGQLRPPQVQGPAQRPAGRRRQALPGRLDADAVPGPAVHGRRPKPAAPRRATTPGSTSSTRSGLGTNVPMATGNANESLMALVDGKWVNMRVPYPMGFFAKWMDGRIDDPNARLEGPRPVDDLRQPHAVPHRNRQGYAAEGGEVPGPSGPARGLIARLRGRGVSPRLLQVKMPGHRSGIFACAVTAGDR